MTVKNNRVYGVIGIRSKMANWNADFSGRPKSTSKNEIFGSDKALKYPMKVSWEQQRYPVLYIKSLKLIKDKKGEEKLQPRTLKERYEFIFNKELGKKKSKLELISDLFSAVDVMNFGATFAEEGQNISITGAVQIGQGMNIYKDSKVEVQDILSPFRNSSASKDESLQSTIGNKIVSDEAHYCYPFSVNPFAYNDYKNIIDGFDGYTEEAYELFKEGALKSATLFATNSKLGCDNEYALFIELKEDSKTAFPDLSQYLKLEKNGENVELDFSNICKLLNGKNRDDIDSVELYYDSFNIQCKGLEELEFVKKFNIYTGEGI